MHMVMLFLDTGPPFYIPHEGWALDIITLPAQGAVERVDSEILKFKPPSEFEAATS